MQSKSYITTDREKLDVNFIHDNLCNRLYWAKGRSRELVEKSIANSLCFGVFSKPNTHIGFARIVTDFVVFAWLMDVFVDDGYRNQGTGRYLLETIRAHPQLKEVSGIGLRTNETHGLYAKFGFVPIPEPNTWMFKKRR
ncbi:MAG: GNAT family N-acetyltransferase [Bacteroidota bacterium]